MGTTATRCTGDERRSDSATPVSGLRSASDLKRRIEEANAKAKAKKAQQEKQMTGGEPSSEARLRFVGTNGIDDQEMIDRMEEEALLSASTQRNKRMGTQRKSTSIKHPKSSAVAVAQAHEFLASAQPWLCLLQTDTKKDGKHFVTPKLLELLEPLGRYISHGSTEKMDGPTIEFWIVRLRIDKSEVAKEVAVCCHMRKMYLLKKLFKAMDTNQSGTLDVQEVQEWANQEKENAQKFPKPGSLSLTFEGVREVEAILMKEFKKYGNSDVPREWEHMFDDWGPLEIGKFIRYTPTKAEQEEINKQLVMHAEWAARRRSSSHTTDQKSGRNSPNPQKPRAASHMENNALPAPHKVLKASSSSHI